MRKPVNRFSPINPSSREPIYRQIYSRFRSAITDGVLAPGERIPAARALAKELGLARGTVDTAYALLTAEGYLQSRGQAGTVVAQGLNVQATRSREAASLSPVSGAALRQKSPVLPFQMALPALDEFPRKIWAQIGARCVRATGVAQMANPSAQGLEPLRSAIAGYLHLARGISCQPSQVFITSGYRNTLTLIVHALLHPGDRVLVENPGYPPYPPGARILADRRAIGCGGPGRHASYASH